MGLERAIDLNGQPPADHEVQLNIPPDLFPGHWANHATVAKTAHEITLDFYRIGPGGRRGLLVSRVNCSPLLLEQLHEAIAAHLEAD
jgi:hypothetical protein